MSGPPRAYTFPGSRPAGFATAVAGAGLVTLLSLTSVRSAIPAVLYVVVIAAAVAVGGTAAGLLAAAASSLPYTYFFTQPPHAFTLSGAGDVVAIVVFVVAAVAIGQLVAHEQRVSARERLAHGRAKTSAARILRLEALARSLGDARMPEDVVEVMLGEGVVAAEAQAGLIALLCEGGSKLEIVGRRGRVAAGPDASSRFGVEQDAPLAEAVRTGVAVYLTTREEGDRRFPLMASAPSGSSACAALPLVSEGRTVMGGLLLGFREEQVFDGERRALMEGLTAQVAQALERTRLYERELEARRTAERSRSQLERSLAQVELERGKLSRLVERLDEGVIAVSADGTIAFSNASAKALLGGADREQAEVLPDDWLGFSLQAFGAALFDSDVRRDAVVEGRESGARYSLTGLPAAGADTALLVIVDLSEQDRREQAARDFVTNAAHELRTPVTSISLAVEALQAGAKESPLERDDFLAHIEHESARLRRLTGSLLVLARTQSRGERPRQLPISLRDLLDEVVDGLEARPDVELVLTCPRALTIVSNRDLLEHAILNLVTNALRYTERGEVRVDAWQGAGGGATIEIRDTGSGIASEVQSRVFERFYRADSQQPGFGLGLAIARQTVETLGGRITLESTPEVGTITRIELPPGEAT